MKTAKDLNDLLKLKESALSSEVDNWLEDEVFPNFKENHQGFKIPPHMEPSLLESMLKIRGFDVSLNCDHQGNVIYIAIPPQGE